MDELLKKAAEIRGLPEMLVERSAKARAEETGQSVEDVLREWVGEEAAAPPAESVESVEEPIDDPGSVIEEPRAATETRDPARPPATPGEVPSEITDDYLVSLAAEVKRMPEKLIRSSAEARAKHAKVPLEVVLADWAGVDLNELRDQAGSAPQSPAASPAEPAPRPEPETKAETRDETPTETPTPASEPAATAAAVLSTDELLEKAAAERGVPASLTKRSAQARADESGQPLDEVLAEWAGVELADDGGQRTEDSTETAAAAPAAAAGTMTLDEVLEKAAEARGVPASLTKRSADARAKEDGTTVEAVLAEWAGVDPSEIASGEAPAAAPAAPAAKPDEVIEAASVESAPAEVEVIEAAAGSPTEDLHEVEQPVKAGRYPAWLAAAFLIIPLLAVTYILIAPNGPDCGVGGQLLTDPVTGEAVNCDGSAYGSTVIDNFGDGAAIYAQCAACHAANGSGGAGPAFVDGELLSTFPSGSCSDQVEWIALGTSGWPDATYGATNKPVGGVGLMPAFGSTLEPEQIAQVALYERVQFGGQDLADAEADCGFGEDGNYDPEGSGGGETAESVEASG